MDCERCGGETWNNTQKNEERAARGEKPLPLLKCKDKNCGWVKWPPKDQAAKPAARSSNGASPAPTRERWTWGDLFEAYSQCHKRIVTVQGEKASPESINAGVATLLIAAGTHNLPGFQTAMKRAEAVKAAEAAAKKQREEAQQRGTDDEEFEGQGDDGMPY